MTGTRFTLVGVLAVTIAHPAVGQEGGYNTPLNAEPLIPIPIGEPGDPGFYTSPYFVLHRCSVLPPRPLDLSRATAGGFGPYCERALPRPTRPIRPAQQLYLQLQILSEPFRPATDEWFAKNVLLGSPN